MHQSSMDVMKRFVDVYLSKEECLDILDVGSQDVNGCYKPLFTSSLWKYYGLDICEGKNVDIIVEDPYNWKTSDQFDVVVSGQCLEHVEAPWLWAKEIERVCANLVCIIAPWNQKIHKYPIDCWRILPDGILYLMTKWCNFEMIEYGSNERDCYFMGRKNK
jgi:hypothetical protein